MPSPPDFSGYIADPAKSRVLSLCFTAQDVPSFPTVVRGVLTGAGFTIQAITYRPPDASLPGTVVVQCAESNFIFMHGTSLLAQASNYWNGFIPPIGVFTDIPDNGYLVSAMGFLSNMLAPLHWATNKVRVYCGYSLGGAILQRYAIEEIKNGPPAVIPTTISFGAPKAGNVVANTYLEGFNVRWMCDNDPVPLFPSVGESDLSVILLYGVERARQIALYVQGPGGVEIRDGGLTAPAVLPSVAGENPNGSLAAWLLAMDLPQSNGHPIQNYQVRLNQWVTLHPTPPRQQQRVGPEERPNPTTRQEQNNSQRAAERAVLRQGAAQDVPNIVIPPQLRCRTVRIGGVWVSSFGESTVGIGPTKRKARRLTRQLNAMLDTLQTMAVVSPASLAAQFETYLAAAQDPSAGFVPVMQTTLPAV